jgi:hypothetical protein
MAKRHEDESGEPATLPATLGEIFPGIVKVVDGVDVHALPIGLAGALIEEGIASQFLREMKRQTIGLSSKDNPAEYKTAKDASTVIARERFFSGVLPMDVSSTSAFVFDEIVDWFRGYRDATVQRAPDPEAALAAWYEKRMTAEEKAELATPRNRARDNCVKRLALAWLNNPELSEAAQKQREALVTSGHEKATAAFERAKARVAAVTRALLTGAHMPSAGTELAVALDDSNDLGV